MSVDLVCLSVNWSCQFVFLAVHLSDCMLTDSIDLSVHRMLEKLLSTAGVHPQMITVFIDGDFEVCASVIAYTYSKTRFQHSCLKFIRFITCLPKYAMDKI